MTVATTIRQQIGLGALMSLGAHQQAAITEHGTETGYTFKARILPFTKKGTRSNVPRIMRVTVILNCLDLYDITVTYVARKEMVTHYEAANIGAEQLATLLLALDYDGERVLNPRLA